MFLWCARDGWRDIYSEIGFLLPISSSRSQWVPTLAPPCKLVRYASDRLCVSLSTAILCTLSKSDHVVLISWSFSDYTPVLSECPDAPSSSWLLIKMWQLTKAQGVTRNEQKIHVIYIYIYIYIYMKFTNSRNRIFSFQLALKGKRLWKRVQIQPWI